MHKNNTKTFYLLFPLVFLFNFITVKAQTHSIILGRPTDTSITASIMFDQAMQYYFEYGTSSGTYSNNTIIFTNTINTPDEIDLVNLQSDTRYYYRVQYHLVSGGTYTATPEYTFHTQRSVGSTFSFTIEADEHLYDKKGVKSMYQVTLNNEAADNPDFMLSLGDIFGDDHTPFSITSDALDSLHRDYRPLLGSICHSIPFYVCLGNHEGENDYYYNFNQPNNLCVWGTQWRKFYYPNPYPNSFYTGNTTNEPFGIGSPENYFAWNWGNALFVVLDVYREQCHDSLVDKPQGWNWTLGQTQYNWLKNTLEGSTAQYKFVFAHHLRGQGRGGVALATSNEWGGNQSATNTNYTFPVNRPGWEKPIHKLFIDNGVNIFFQGHDHVFAHEVLDSVTYQAVPMAADSTYEIGMLANADAYVSDTVDGTGHIRVKVSPSCVTVDFVRAYLPADTNATHHNGEVAFSYTIGNCTTGINTVNKNDDIKVYPNPANTILSVKIPDGINNYGLNLVNMLGETLLQSKVNVIDIHNIPDGIYFVNVQTDKSSFNKKIVITH